MKTLDAGSVNRKELDKVDDVVAALPADSQLAEALAYVTSTVRRGMGVTLAGVDEKVSPAMAARLLGMSRTHLYKLLDAGEIPSVSVGRDRRLTMADVEAFRARQGKQRASLAERFAHAGAARTALIDSLEE